MEQDESDHEDINRGQIRQNMARLLARDQSIDSHEYEWESLSNASCELGVDVIHTYATKPNVVDKSSIGSNEFGSQYAFMDHTSPSRSISDLDSFATFTIGSPSHVTRDDCFHINNLKVSTSLLLVHPDLIDWSIQNERPEIQSFQNDYEIACYLNAIELVTSSTSELVVNMKEPNIKYLNHKIKRKNEWSDLENHVVAMSELKKSKKKRHI